jgi:hypothetical protein
MTCAGRASTDRERKQQKRRKRKKRKKDGVKRREETWEVDVSEADEELTACPVVQRPTHRQRTEAEVEPKRGCAVCRERAVGIDCVRPVAFQSSVEQHSHQPLWLQLLLLRPLPSPFQSLQRPPQRRVRLRLRRHRQIEPEVVVVGSQVLDHRAPYTGTHS